ncbi:MAG: AmmeMemoRadiSam system protein B [Pseudomonadota bacterium]
MLLGSRVSFCAVLTFLSLAFPGFSQGETKENRFLAAANDPAIIQAAMAAEKVVAEARITGVTVPHHILAADLIARGIRAASGGDYDRILVIGPDHFRSLNAPFGVLTEPAQTAFGPLMQDQEAIAHLRASDLFEDVGSAPREHAIHTLTPFLQAMMPGIPVTMITTASRSQRRDWDGAVEILAPLLGPKSLIVQSTDYSHFLPRDVALLRDIETLGVIVANNPELVSTLSQPSHLDSKASQYLQMRLQERVHGARPMVVAHRDAHDYVPSDTGNGPTTSYFVTLYSDDPSGLSALSWEDHRRVVFGGDVFLGRGWSRVLETREAFDPILKDLEKRRGPGAFMVNLEGVLLEERPAGSNPVQHLMLAKSALAVLENMGVDAGNMANNHSHDFGSFGLEETFRLLDASGIIALIHNRIQEFGNIALLPLSFRRGYFADHPVIRQIEQLETVCDLATRKPVVVLTHWGADYTNRVGPLEKEALEVLANCGVAAVIGAHSHLASKQVTLHGGGRLQAVFSMGNLIFDQTGDDVSGALVELRQFEKGTIALRLIPIPNYYEMVVR